MQTQTDKRVIQLPLRLDDGEASQLRCAYDKTRLRELGISYDRATRNDALLRCLRNLAGI